MKEIKFRTWDKIHNKMWYSGQEGKEINDWSFQMWFDTKNKNLQSALVTEIDVGCSRPVVKEEYLPIMQYTGLKDKNGIEVYEGDLVRCFGGEHYLGKWEFDETIEVKDLIEDGFMLKQSENIEVLGNIYEGLKGDK